MVLWWVGGKGVSMSEFPKDEVMEVRDRRAVGGVVRQNARAVGEWGVEGRVGSLGARRTGREGEPGARGRRGRERDEESEESEGLARVVWPGLGNPR